MLSQPGKLPATQHLSTSLYIGGEKVLPGFVDFQNFAQGFGFGSREPIFDSREFQTTYQVGISPGL